MPRTSKICYRFVSKICWKVLNMHKNSHGLNSNNCEIFNVAVFFFSPHKSYSTASIDLCHSEYFGSCFCYVQNISFNKLFKKKNRMCTTFKLFTSTDWVWWEDHGAHEHTAYDLVFIRLSIYLFEFCYFSQAKSGEYLRTYMHKFTFRCFSFPYECRYVSVVYKRKTCSNQMHL